MFARIARNYVMDLKKFPEIAPVTFIVIAAVLGATAFMPWKLTHTPDVIVNPAKPYSWEDYAGKPTPYFKFN